MTFWALAWLRAFSLTLAVEAVIAVPWLRSVEPRRARRFAAVAVANVATHPLVWFMFPGLSYGPRMRFASSELWAFLAEAAIYRLVWPALSFRRSLLVSLVANGASVVAGWTLLRP